MQIARRVARRSHRKVVAFTVGPPESPRAVKRRGSATGAVETDLDRLAAVNERVATAAGSARGPATHEADGDLQAAATDLLRRAMSRRKALVIEGWPLGESLDFWAKAVARCDLAPAFIILVPSADGLVASAAADAVRRRQAELVWLRHLVDVEAASRGMARMFALLPTSEAERRALVKRADKKLGVKPGFALGATPRPVRRAAHQEPIDLLAQTLSILAGWSRSGEDPGDFRKLNRIRSSLNQAADLFGPVVDAATRVRELEKETATLRSRLAAQPAAPVRSTAAPALPVNPTKPDADTSEARLRRSTDELAVLATELIASQTKREATEARFDGLRTLVVEGLSRLVPNLIETGAAGFALEVRVKYAMALLDATGLFDAAWYLENNPDVAQSGMDPLRHYATHGAAEGRAPNPYLDTN